MFENETNANAPNASMAMLAYTPTFGNMNLVITLPQSMRPGKPDQVQAGFPMLPYFPIEPLLYQAQASNPVVAPNNIVGGSQPSVQNISGSQTIKDSNNETVYQAGYSSQGFA